MGVLQVKIELAPYLAPYSPSPSLFPVSEIMGVKSRDFFPIFLFISPCFLSAFGVPLLGSKILKGMKSRLNIGHQGNLDSKEIQRQIKNNCNSKLKNRQKNLNIEIYLV